MAEDFPPLTQNQKIRLLRIAREAIYYLVSRGKAPEVVEPDPRLSVTQGVFVSLHIGDRLRGCIGTFAGSGPLHRTVVEMAVSAASDDPRFSPLRMDEVPRVDIELSVLGPLRDIRPEDVVVGKDGLLVAMGRSRGTLLPQVAEQYGWTREEFLSQTCVKAGLDQDDWRDGDCRIQAFTAEVFCESQMRPGA